MHLLNREVVALLSDANSTEPAVEVPKSPRTAGKNKASPNRQEINRRNGKGNDIPLLPVLVNLLRIRSQSSTDLATQAGDLVRSDIGLEGIVVSFQQSTNDWSEQP